ncbi:MAG: CRISPR-associated protein, partial [Cardiobacterium hominis]
MPDFLNRHTLHLTPLSPIHLGTGEDYEPTNYVINTEEKALYAFDPARAELDANQRGKLLNIAKSGDIQQIQKYFADNPEPFRTAAHSISSVSDAIASEYQKSLGQVVQREQRGSHTDAVYNRLNIERTATNPHTCAPLIPGSALKGCLRTALLEERSANH